MVKKNDGKITDAKLEPVKQPEPNPASTSDADNLSDDGKITDAVKKVVDEGKLPPLKKFAKFYKIKGENK